MLTAALNQLKEKVETQIPSKCQCNNRGQEEIYRGSRLLSGMLSLKTISNIV